MSRALGDFRAQCLTQRRPANIFGQSGVVRFQDGTRKARKNTVIPCESIGAAATNRRWGILEPRCVKPMPPGQHIRPVRRCVFGQDRKASGNFHEPLDLQR